MRPGIYIQNNNKGLKSGSAGFFMGGEYDPDKRKYNIDENHPIRCKDIKNINAEKPEIEFKRRIYYYKDKLN